MSEIVDRLGPIAREKRRSDANTKLHGELPGRVAAIADLTRESITIIDQEYFDIGAGRPNAAVE